MPELEISTVGEFLSAMWFVIKGVLKLDADVFIATVLLPNAWILAVGILFVAGISDILGQSVVLFANRVSPRRFTISIVMSAVLFILSVLLYTFAIWVVVKFAMGMQGNFGAIWVLVALSYAPLVFSFFALLPYLGNAVYQLVRIWSVLALIAGVAAVSTDKFWQGLLACLVGWLLVQFFTRLPILRVDAIDAWLWRIMTGTSQKLDAQMLADQMAIERGEAMRRGSAGEG